MRTFLLGSLALAATATIAAHAQAHGGCVERPHTLAAMHSCYRPILIFSPSASDPRFKQQEATLDSAADDMMDRFMLFVPVLAATKSYTAPLDAPSATLSAAQLAQARRRFHVPRDAFRVVLFDEDGSSVLESPEPLSMSRINAVIDAMPRRKEEETRRDSN